MDISTSFTSLPHSLPLPSGSDALMRTLAPSADSFADTANDETLNALLGSHDREALPLLGSLWRCGIVDGFSRLAPASLRFLMTVYDQDTLAVTVESLRQRGVHIEIVDVLRQRQNA